MSGESHHFRAPPVSICPIKLAEADSIKLPEEVQLLKAGVFEHPEYGVFEITPETFKSFKANFDNRVRGVDLAIDFGHESEEAAAGWMKDLMIRGDNGGELWAKVVWSTSGQKALLGKEYRYLSSEFTFNYKSNENPMEYGPTLLGAGLTNRPVIKGMAPVIELTESAKSKGKDEEMELKEENKKLQERNAELERQLAEMQANDKQKKLEQKLSAAEAENKTLKEAAAKSEQEKKLAEKKSVFDRMLSEGKAVEAQREHFMTGDMVKFAELAKPLNLNGKGSDGNGGNNVAKGDVDEQIHELAEKALTDKRVKTLSEGYRLVLNENDELRKKKYGNA